MKKLLFIDQDGTIVAEPRPNYQLDSWSKLQFMPGVIGALKSFSALADFELVIVTNQDGLGTEVFPEQPFLDIHRFVINTLAQEGIHFAEICIDRSFPHENSPMRKPGTGMLTKYINSNQYDLSKSFVIGDRPTDLLLAKALGCQGIYLQSDLGYELTLTDHALLEQASPFFTAQNWSEIQDVIFKNSRFTRISRETSETKIQIELNLEGNGKSNISTGLHFFDHMLDQLCRHGGIDLTISTKGDLQVDEHHTIEDTALALGQAFKQALGSKVGIERYGYCLPMDDCQAQVSIDFGGRPWLEWHAEFRRERIGDMPCEMFKHFFKSFSDSAACNLFIRAEGENEHHKIEAIYKAWAKSVKMAILRNPAHLVLPSTKGIL